MQEVGVIGSEEALHNRLCIVHGETGTYRTFVNDVHLWAVPYCKRDAITGERVFGVVTGRDHRLTGEDGSFSEQRFIAENALEQAMHRLGLEEHGPEDPPFGQIAVLLIKRAANDLEELKRDVEKKEEEEAVPVKHRDEIVCPEQWMEESPWRNLEPQEQDRAAAERYIREAHAFVTPDEQYAIAQLSMQTRLLVEVFDRFGRTQRKAFKA